MTCKLLHKYLHNHFSEFSKYYLPTKKYNMLNIYSNKIWQKICQYNILVTCNIIFFEMAKN